MLILKNIFLIILKFFKTILYSLLFLVGIILNSCDKNSELKKQVVIKKDSLLYLNHSDSAKYVGINTCKLCHQDIYNTYIKTGMGKSFDVASKTKSVGDYKHAAIYDKIGDYYYKAYWE